MSNQGFALRGTIKGILITLAYAHAAAFGHVLIGLFVLRFFTRKVNANVF